MMRQGRRGKRASGLQTGAEIFHDLIWDLGTALSHLLNPLAPLVSQFSLQYKYLRKMSLTLLCRFIKRANTGARS